MQIITLEPPTGSYDFWAHDEGGQLQKWLPLRGKELDIPLRGPMLSSWKATFTTGWTVNTDYFVSKLGTGFRFKAELVTPGFAAPIDECSAEYVLPEGAVIKNIGVPLDANVSQYMDVQNLDLNGRPVVRVELNRLASTDVIPITIDYELSFGYNFLKILLLGAAFCVFFVGIALCRRVDLAINVQAPPKEKED